LGRRKEKANRSQFVIPAPAFAGVSLSPRKRGAGIQAFDDSGFRIKPALSKPNGCGMTGLSALNPKQDECANDETKSTSDAVRFAKTNPISGGQNERKLF